MDTASNTPSKIACISDTHLFPNSVKSEALFPNWVKALGPVKGPQFYKSVVAEVRRAYETALTFTRAQKPDAILHFGDLTGGWRERGLVDPSVVKIAHDAYDDMSKIAPTYVAAGNHDTGYHHPKIEGSDISEQSVQACEDAFQRLWWETSQQNLRILGICSPIAQYQGKEAKLLARQKDQKEFLGDMLQQYRGEPWALCTHDLSIDSLAPLLDEHLPTCEQVLHGDLHNPTNARFANAFQYLKNLKPGQTGRVARTLISKSVLIPSTAPLWWKGYQMRMAKWDGKNLDTNIVKLERPKDSVNVPTASFAKSLWGMIRGKTVKAIQEQE